MVRQYLEHSRFILSDKNSVYQPNRTDVDSISRFGYQAEYDLSEGFPLLTTKKMGIKTILHELIWFLRGDTNIEYLVKNGVHFWTDNAFDFNFNSDRRLVTNSPQWTKERNEYAEKISTDHEYALRYGNLGNVYGAQWRAWKTSDGKTVDQIGELVRLLKNNPRSRRMIVTAWNPEEVPKVALPACHALYQFNVRDGKLDCQLYQRSADMFLGVPYNIASYAALTQIMAQEADLELGSFIHSFGNAHFYCGKGERGTFYEENLDDLKLRIRNVESREDYLKVKEWINDSAPPDEGYFDHVPAVLEQMSRDPKPLPRLEITKKPFQDLTIDDFRLIGYDSHPPLKASMAV